MSANPSFDQTMPPTSSATLAGRRELCDLVLAAAGDVMKFGGALALAELDAMEKRGMIVQKEDGWFLSLSSEPILDSKTLVWSLYVPELLQLSAQHRERWVRIQQTAYEILFLHYLCDIHPFVAESSPLSIFRLRVVYTTQQEVAEGRKLMELMITNTFVSRLINACGKAAMGYHPVSPPADAHRVAS